MIGRLDTRKGICDECRGTGKDPKNRKRPCQYCKGSALVDVCKTCGRIVGRGCNTDSFDATYCEMKSNKGESE